MRVISYVDRRGQTPRIQSVEMTVKAFRQRGKKKAGRRDKDLANGRVTYMLS